MTYKSTSKMLYLANRYKVSFVYGLISEKTSFDNPFGTPTYKNIVNILNHAKKK